MGIIDSAILFLLLIGGATAFVFSCDEVKYKLVNSNLQEPTQFVCLVLENNYPLESLKHIYAQVDKVSTSFYELASVQCIERPSKGAWRIVADTPVNLNCDIEFSLVFTSTPPSITGLPVNDFDYKLTTVLDSANREQIVVAPSTGIVLHKIKCTGNGNVKLFTGAGGGVSEYRYTMFSWNCDEIPDWIIWFENVVSIAVDDGMQLEIDQTLIAYMKEINVSTSIHVAVMSSGRSDNLQNKEGIDNTIRFNSGGKELIASAACSPCTFDPRYDGQIRLTTYDVQGRNTSTDIIRDQGFYYPDFKGYLEVGYEISPIAPQNIWENDDTFVMDLFFTGVAEPSTPPLVPASEEYCTCAVDKKFGMPVDWDTTEIWIDAVIIVDTSEAMGAQAIIDAITLIYSFFGTEDDDVLTTNTNAAFYTRVGLISMSDKPEVLYNLNMTKTDKIDGKIQMKTGLNQIDVVAAFNTALQMLSDGRANNPDRQNSRPVIYYMTNSNPPTLPETMKQFKLEQGIIIVNNFIENGAPPRLGLKDLASPGYFYSDIQYDYMATIQLFCKANCYCLHDKQPYYGQNPDSQGTASGGCFRPVPVGSQFPNARANCAHGSGLIASIHDNDKANFVNGIMRKAAPNSDYYWIGYSKSDAGWKWEDQSPNPFTRWDVGEPNTASVAKCTYVDANSVMWGAGNCNVGFPFPCEYAPCSVGNKNCTLPA